MRTGGNRGNGTEIGRNRTGLATSPVQAAELIESTRETVPSAGGDASGLSAVRISYARGGEPPGTMPPPAMLKGLGKAALEALQGHKMTLLMDKVGERLAFERSGTRLYDALLSKFDAYGTWSGGPTRAQLEEIRTDERTHYLMLKDVATAMGADPTAVTPSADVAAVATQGLCAVLTDPRTDLRQGLETILHAELVDNDRWETLLELARSLGQKDLVSRGEEALAQEREHLRLVHLWLSAGLSIDATGRSETNDRTAARSAQKGTTTKKKRSGGASSRSRTASRKNGARRTRRRKTG